MGHLLYHPHNAHRVRVGERELLFHIPTTSLFEIDALDGEVLGFFAERGRVGEADVQARFADRDPEDVVARIRSLLDLEIVTDGRRCGSKISR